MILADAEMLGDPVGNSQQNTPAELAAGHTLGQSFTVGQPVESVGGRFPTWAMRGSAMTLTLFAGNPTGKQICSKRFEDVSDNAWLSLRFDPPLPPGTYYLQMSRPAGKVGWWSHTADVWPGGQALADGKPVAGDRTLWIFLADGPGAAIRRFFTFRAAARLLPRPDEARYVELGRSLSAARLQEFAGRKRTNVGHRGPECRRWPRGLDERAGGPWPSFHNGAVDRRRNAVLYGHNVAEQWERALKEDPKFIFITGWNEWFAGRYDEFAGIRQPVMFVDEFDQEHSRDIEPMQGGHGDNYYYQMVSYIRRYKGARPLPAVTPAPIRIDGRFDDWAAVGPEFRDTIDDAMRRNHPGYGTQARTSTTAGETILSPQK